MMLETGLSGLGTTVQRKGSAQQLADLVLERILNGQIAPGTPLRESVLAREGNVARNTAREAIRILVAEGLVEHSPNKGAAVCQIAPEDVHDIYRVRLMAELEGVRSAHRLTMAQKIAFEDSLTRFTEAGTERDPGALVRADLHFHTLIVDLAASPRLDRLYRSIANEVRFGFSLLTAADRETDNAQPLVDEHRAIYQTLHDGDLEECTRLLTEHLDLYRCRMTDLLTRRAATDVALGG